jgi:hypothetical protein
MGGRTGERGNEGGRTGNDGADEGAEEGKGGVADGEVVDLAEDNRVGCDAEKGVNRRRRKRKRGKEGQTFEEEVY